MNLFYFMLFLASIALNVYALETIIMDYSNIDYEEITVYDLREDRKEPSPCEYYNDFRFYR